MLKTKIYKCEYCKTVVCLPSNYASFLCPTCGKNMKQLDDDFDLSEIITCNQEDGEIEES
jgi:predicted RNA-binding Zn-ribbon protein involved in translation (DUF1610 family)